MFHDNSNGNDNTSQELSNDTRDTPSGQGLDHSWIWNNPGEGKVCIHIYISCEPYMNKYA